LESESSAVPDMAPSLPVAQSQWLDKAPGLLPFPPPHTVDGLAPFPQRNAHINAFSLY